MIKLAIRVPDGEVTNRMKAIQIDVGLMTTP
jgi:hypothetical protein